MGCRGTPVRGCRTLDIAFIAFWFLFSFPLFLYRENVFFPLFFCRNLGHPGKQQSSLQSCEGRLPNRQRSDLLRRRSFSLMGYSVDLLLPRPVHARLRPRIVIAPVFSFVTDVAAVVQLFFCIEFGSYVDGSGVGKDKVLGLHGGIPVKKLWFRLRPPDDL